MGALVAAAVGPFAGGVPRGAAPAPCDASERASGKKPRRVVAPARDNSSVCLAGVEELLYVPSQKPADTKVLTAVGEMSARELLQKRLASELDTLRGLLKQAELISRRGACKDGGAGAPTAGKKERLLAASKQRLEPTENGGGNAPSVKKRKNSTLVEQKQKQIRARRMSAEERSQLAGRLSSLSEELPGHVVEFLQKQFGDADTNGEIEIDIDSVEDSILLELKTQLDKVAQERERRPVVDVLPVPEEKDEKLAEESKSKGILEVHLCGIVQTGSRPSSRSSSGTSNTGSRYSDCKSDSDDFLGLREALRPEQIIATSAQPPSVPPASGTAQSGEAKKVQDVQRAAPKPVNMRGLLYRAKVRRQLMETERTKLPDESIHPWDLQRLGIAGYGNHSLMRQLGLFLKADAA